MDRRITRLQSEISMKKEFQNIIVEIAADAGYDSQSYDPYSGFDLEKFSEILIQRCITIADKRGAYEVMDDIIDHFDFE